MPRSLSKEADVYLNHFSSRINELLIEYRRENRKQTDELFFWLMFCQWMSAIGIAVLFTPQTWIGDTPYVHMHMWMAVIFGGVISVPAMVATRVWSGTQFTCYVVAIAQGVWTGFLIHLTGGRLETHFHAFGSLAFLTLYRDWRVLVVTTLMITADHAVRGTFWPLSVYGVAVDSTWRFVEHFAWVAWLDTILLIACFRHEREGRSICERRAELELTNAAIEDRIRLRTEELEIANLDLQREHEAKERLNEELLIASRKAGMAEIATGVLHNIGNVLNSLNVSTQMLSDRLLESQVERLRKAADIVIEHRGNLGAFVTEDRRGKFLPDMLDQLSDNLLEDRDAELKELNNVRNSISHVREIINKQQEVARGNATVGRSFDLEVAISEALRMSELESGFALKLDYEGEAKVILDKHLFLQILVNLLSNARQATMREAEKRRANGEADFEPSVAIETVVQDESIKISVTDNGIGIPKNNLSNIFQHGFTTREKGSGFGLHSSAIHARTLGGRLSVSSDGDGLGAKFTLELPQSKLGVNSKFNEQERSHEPAS